MMKVGKNMDEIKMIKPVRESAVKLDYNICKEIIQIGNSDIRGYVWYQGNHLCKAIKQIKSTVG